MTVIRLLVFITLIAGLAGCSTSANETRVLTEQYHDLFHPLYLQFREALRIACETEDISGLKPLITEAEAAYYEMEVKENDCSGLYLLVAEPMSATLFVESYDEENAIVWVLETMSPEVIPTVYNHATVMYEYGFVKEDGHWRIAGPQIVRPAD